MKNRRGFLLTLTAGLVAAVVIITPVIAEEFFGAVTNVDLEGNKITVLTKGGEEVEVKTTDKTEVTSPKGEMSLEKLAKYVAKVKEAGKKGAIVKVTHEGKVASKIEIVAGKKKAEN
jgi:hypothetical protein